MISKRIMATGQITDSCGGASHQSEGISGRDVVKENLESISVIGLSLKFPQDAISPDSFWSVLMDRRCAMTEIPKDRFNASAFYHPDPKRLDAVSIKHYMRAFTVKGSN